MKEFDHFIITRFNLKQSVWNADKDGKLVNDDDWLKERYDIFLTYCFPSVKTQTISNFKWLVYFDQNTPDFYKKKNKELHSSYRAFLPVYVSSFSAFEKDLPNRVCELKNDKHHYIITTRLDNDDALHEDAVKAIQKEFITHDKTIIDLTHGLALQIVDEHKLSVKKNIVSGPFISLVEHITDNKTPLTVYDREHTTWNDIAIFKTVKNGFYWLQIIHQRNITNGLSNELTFNKNYLKGFHILDTVHFSFKYYTFIILKELKLIKFIKRILK